MGRCNDIAKIEARFDPEWITALSNMGHETEVLPDYSDLVGHAGAVVTHTGGLVEAATDPAPMAWHWRAR